MKLCSELTFHLLITLQGSLSMSLYRLFSVSLLTRFAFFPRLEWHETRLDIMERCFFPLLLSGTLYIIGTILRRTNRTQSKVKGQLLSRVRMYKSSTFGHSKGIFSDLENFSELFEIVTHHIFEFVRQNWFWTGKVMAEEWQALSLKYSDGVWERKEAAWIVGIRWERLDGGQVSCYWTGKMLLKMYCTKRRLELQWVV